MLRSTIFAASSGPTALDDRRQRLVAVAVGALVVREVGRPHHPVDADAVDQVEAERVEHERRHHVVLPVPPGVVLGDQVVDVVERRGEVLGVLQHRRHPVDAAFEEADLQAGVAVEDPAEDELAERIAERGDRLQHADLDGVVLVGCRRRGLADVERHRETDLLDHRPHVAHRRAGVVDRDLVVVLAGVERHEERLEPERLQFLERAPRAVGVPPVDEADAVDASAGALLHVGDVLVVDPEADLADLLVGPAEQRQDRVREGELLVDPFGVERREAGVDVAGVGAGQRVVLGEHLEELRVQDRLAAHADRPAAVDVQDLRDLVLHRLRCPFDEDVLRQRDVVVGGEHLGADRQPEVVRGKRPAVLGRAPPAGRIGQRGRHGFPSLVAFIVPDRAVADYFGFVAIVNRCV